MAFFYLLHQSPYWLNLPDGRRNLRVFMIGVICYVFINIVLEYIRRVHSLMDSVYYGMRVILIADVCTMAYIYKNHYGRPIFQEFNPDSEEIYDYNQDTHHYTLKEDEQHNLKTIKDNLGPNLDPNSDPNPNDIRDRASRKIQRWWKRVRGRIPPNPKDKKKREKAKRYALE